MGEGGLEGAANGAKEGTPCWGGGPEASGQGEQRLPLWGSAVPHRPP